MDQYMKVAIIDNEIEAQIIRDILIEQKIPFSLRSYYDSAYDGLFQMQRGWGCLYAAEEFKEVILEILADLRRGEETTP